MKWVLHWGHSCSEIKRSQILVKVGKFAEPHRTSDDFSSNLCRKHVGWGHRRQMGKCHKCLCHPGATRGGRQQDVLEHADCRGESSSKGPSFLLWVKTGLNGQTQERQKKHLEASLQLMVLNSKTCGCPMPRKSDVEGSALKKTRIIPSKAQGTLWNRGRKNVIARRSGEELCNASGRTQPL